MLNRVFKVLFLLSLPFAAASIYIFWIYFSVDIEQYNNKNPRSPWIKESAIPKKAKWAFIVSEDWAFYEHKGLDFNQLKIVIEESFKSQKLTRGASTISQQVVKNLFLSNEKTLNRKFKEMILTYKLEKTLSKDRILEIYLNIIEFGKDLYGIGGASLHYFYKSAKNLSVREAAFLAMLLPNPKKYNISYRNGELTEYANDTMQKIFVKLRQAKIITEEERLEIIKERFTWESSSLDFYEDYEE